MQATLFRASPAVRLRGTLVSPELAEFLTDLPVAIIHELIESGEIGCEIIRDRPYVALDQIDAAANDRAGVDSPNQRGGRSR
jgi:hypothetical protein